MYAKRYSRGWMCYRLSNLLKKEQMSTQEVRAALKLSESVIRRWIADPYFQKNQIARKSKDGFWIWDATKLKLWVAAVVKFKKEVREHNPSTGISKEQAREILGFPERGYRGYRYDNEE